MSWPDDPKLIVRVIAEDRDGAKQTVYLSDGSDGWAQHVTVCGRSCYVASEVEAGKDTVILTIKRKPASVSSEDPQGDSDA